MYPVPNALPGYEVVFGGSFVSPRCMVMLGSVLAVLSPQILKVVCGAYEELIDDGRLAALALLAGLSIASFYSQILGTPRADCNL